MKHTPTPWKAGRISLNHTVQIMDMNGRAIAQAWDFVEAAANAKRIVDCVNACEGISNEALESGVIRELLESLRAIINTKGDIAINDEAWINAEIAIAKAEGK